MDITKAELMAHPMMKQVTADIAETRAKREAEQTQSFMEQQRLRQEQGRYLHEQYAQSLAEYERLRKETHAAVGSLWGAVQAYSRLTASPPQGFAESIFNTIDLPTLKPNPSPWAMSQNFTTTQAAVAGWFATHGKTWS